MGGGAGRVQALHAVSLGSRGREQWPPPWYSSLCSTEHPSLVWWLLASESLSFSAECDHEPSLQGAVLEFVHMDTGESPQLSSQGCTACSSTLWVKRDHSGYLMELSLSIYS
jgi:hypothetical protein